MNSQPKRKGIKKIPPRHVMAYGVHVFTALGASLGFLALYSVIGGDLTAAFWWLGAALFVDAADGPMARALNVRVTASRYDGSVLDLVVDFITYVFVPAAMLLRPEVMPHPYGLVAGLMITIGSALYFADTTMKTDDWWFRGFPAVWNVVVFYIVVFAPPVWLAMLIVVVATVLMFLPVIFVHPVRVTRWRALTMVMLALWAIGAVGALVQRLQPDFWFKAALMVTLAYFVGLGLLRQSPTAREADLA